MKLVQVQLSEDLAEAAQLNRSNPSADAARLLALELFREDKISLGRAAELCETPVEAFMEFAGQRQVPLHYGAAELEADRNLYNDALTEEDRQAVAASREYLRQNPDGGVSFEQVVAECGFTMDEVRNYKGDQ